MSEAVPNSADFTVAHETVRFGDVTYAVVGDIKKEPNPTDTDVKVDTEVKQAKPIMNLFSVRTHSF